ncbi:MAG: diaminopimelate epimerase [Gammaproteobacteria bacterium]|jgi:diaminopimelate epimerase|nr:diaminopimelate epimerase [Gammaproteobacteria bacterium]MBT3858596.1 diaminopimelate epimerase [Gammaproteobacteria bacterium]MBT3986666.1 diaminopimelate epimerase [Gammaproteobacteria bacterium]MBT4254982.1 diaminopimelate epimerase [Gammaproteobacteria bacterium]MBT4582762.1 diaminopimelate epimerase [Gammaproteobacteria bacterium]
MQINFTKMHGLGNDFMVLDLCSQPMELSAEKIRELSDRHFGIGFDQLLQIEKASSDDVDFDYRIFNADGDEVEHCGNGARCFAKYVYDKKLSTKNPIRVKTPNRTLSLLRLENGEVTVDMEKPVFETLSIPFVSDSDTATYRRTLKIGGDNVEVEFSALSMGNPHAVIVVDDVDKAEVERIGIALGSHSDFPEGVNVGFMQILDRSTINLRVYERGAGETLACGTGACAAVVAGCRRGLLDDTVRAILRGGELSINWQQNDEPVLMTGPAETAYEGTIEI